MELYEIVKNDITDAYKGGRVGKSTIITATTDKQMAEQMLEIYKQYETIIEKYEIRTLYKVDE